MALIEIENKSDIKIENRFSSLNLDCPDHPQEFLNPALNFDGDFNISDLRLYFR